MDRGLAFGVICGLSVGLVGYRFLVADWHLALGVATVYAGAGYFYVAFDGSLLDADVTFETRRDRLGYAVGMFGMSVSPLAFVDYYREEVAVALLAWMFGVIAFLLLASATHRRQ